MSDQLIIRTMKDDIAEMNSIPPVALAPKPKREKVQPPVFSLPSKSKPIEVTPAANPIKKRTNIVLGVSYIVLFFLIMGGGIYAYMRWGFIQIPGGSSEQEPPLSQMVPKEALLLVDYNLETDNNRNAVKQLWTERSGESLNGPVNGNPTSLLDIQDVGHAYYVVIPDNQAPFLLLKKTEGIKQYVSQHRELQPLENSGWYIMSGANSEDQYTNLLANGGAMDQGSLTAPSNNPNYLVRYAMSADFVSQQFNMIAAPTIGLSRHEGLVFQILTPTSDGTIRASAYVPSGSSDEGVLSETGELISLVPSDLSFGHIGLNFSAELDKMQSEETSSLDGNILTQPAVRQFISMFNTPYAVFERKGSDGVRDIGLIITLPASLRKNIKTGEPIVEQALPALIPLVVGKALGIQVAFNDGLYNAVPVRYVNINGQAQTLDYVIGDNFLMISSSREGISALVDTSLAGKQGISLEEPWKSLGEKATDAIANRPFIIGTLNDPIVKSLLPVSSTLNQVPIIVSSQKTSTGTDIEAVLLSR